MQTDNLLSPSQLVERKNKTMKFKTTFNGKEYESEEVSNSAMFHPTMNLTFHEVPKPEIDTGYNFADKSKEQFYVSLENKVEQLFFSPTWTGYIYTATGNIFNSREAAQRALDNGYNDRLRNEAEVTAAYHRHVDPLEWGEDGRCCVPTTEGMDEFRLLHTGYIFPFPNTDSGKAACLAFLAEVGADKLREIYYPGGMK